MKKFVLMLSILGLTQGCHVNNEVTESKLSNELPPTIQFGSTCRINYCNDCRIQSCSIGGQDLIGASCSCNTRHGIQIGIVGN